MAGRAQSQEWHGTRSFMSGMKSFAISEKKIVDISEECCGKQNSCIIFMI